MVEHFSAGIEILETGEEENQKKTTNGIAAELIQPAAFYLSCQVQTEIANYSLIFQFRTFVFESVSGQFISRSILLRRTSARKCPPIVIDACEFICFSRFSF
jgi:hypothetical protein